MGKKRVMTVDELLAFVKEQRMSSFSSKENGFALAVQMPGVFRFTADDDRRECS